MPAPVLIWPTFVWMSGKKDFRPNAFPASSALIIYERLCAGSGERFNYSGAL
jgi:hypothetical protein